VNITRLEAFYRSGDVKRLHTVATVNEHSIAAHVYGSMIIAAELAEANELGLYSLGPILFTLLYHDAPEVDTGDVPAPVKRANPTMSTTLGALETAFYGRHDLVMPSLSALGEQIVKASDTLDLCFNCLRERRLGNRTAPIETVFRNALSYLDEYNDLGGVMTLTSHLRQEWIDV
jgi:5'-deoxynucleotidase YfbR-like HD superfamily hydrolase